MTKSIPSVLQRIVASKQQEVATAQAAVSFTAIREQAEALHVSHTSPRRGFAQALRRASQRPAEHDHTSASVNTNIEPAQTDPEKTDPANTARVGIIAEIKRASPSKGIICHDFDPVRTAKQYAAAGASCLSVLTDRDYFGGDDRYLQQARTACQLPILRKDFMIDAYQIYQSYLLGADCVLLIVACLDDECLAQLHGIACELDMDVLIEVHTADELQRALQLPVSRHNIYGINNRDLNTFAVDLHTSIRLADTLRAAIGTDALLVSESGIHSSDDIKLMQAHDIHHFLIGEQFMKTEHPGNALQALLQQL